MQHFNKVRWSLASTRHDASTVILNQLRYAHKRLLRWTSEHQCAQVKDRCRRHWGLFMRQRIQKPRSTLRLVILAIEGESYSTAPAWTSSHYAIDASRIGTKPRIENRFQDRSWLSPSIIGVEETVVFQGIYFVCTRHSRHGRYFASRSQQLQRCEVLHQEYVK